MPDDYAGMKLTARPDLGLARQIDAVIQPTPGADADVPVDDAVGTDGYVVGQLRLGVDNRGRMYRHGFSLYAASRSTERSLGALHL